MTEDEAEGAATTGAPKRRRRRTPIGQSIGGVLFGFEQQVWRTRPPAEEMVHHARPDDPIPAKDGGRIVIGLPDDTIAPPDEPADDAHGGPAR
jgi:hypothetical protein